MIGLREKQKEQRGQRILDAVRSLITERGCGITVENIAARAEVGVATVYNYFNSRSGLVLALFTRETELLLEEGRAIVAHPPQNAVKAVNALLRSYVVGMANRWDKELLRELMASLFREQVPSLKEAMRLDLMLGAQLNEMIMKLQEQGDIVADVDPIDATTLLYSAFVADFMTYLIDDDMTLKLLEQSLQKRTRLIFRGLSPH
jgi:AcrR family transcriptional regulator